MGIVAPLLLSAGVALASESTWDRGDALALPADRPVLFVTHASKAFDKKEVAKAGTTAAVRAFIAKGWPVLYLNNHDSPLFDSYLPPMSPVIDLQSEDGAHAVPLATRRIAFAGGFIDERDGCARRTVVSAMVKTLAGQVRAGVKEPSLTVVFVKDALYHGGDTTLADLPAASFFDSYFPAMTLEGRAYGLLLSIHDEGVHVKTISPDPSLPRVSVTLDLKKSAGLGSL